MNLETIFRMLTGLIFFTGLGVSGYFRHRADQERGEKISRRADGTPTMIIILIGGLLLWLSPLAYLINPQWLAWSKIGLPVWLRWVGISLGFLCTLSIYWLFSSIGSGITPTSATRQEHSLITSGPYQWVRHPLYTTGAVFFISLGLTADSWFIILLGMFSFLMMAARTPREEANLVEKFGDEYRAYQARTGMFLPGISKKQDSL